VGYTSYTCVFSLLCCGSAVGCGVLHCAAVCCSVVVVPQLIPLRFLKRVLGRLCLHLATHCNALQTCNLLQRTATHCDILQHIARQRVYCDFFFCESTQVRLTGWRREVGGWGRDPFSRNFMKPTPRRKWYLTTGRRFH